MTLHQVIGRICAVFSVVVFTYNVFTPHNPDHWLNLAETLVLSILFITALYFSPKVAKTLHVLLFMAMSTIAVFTDTGFAFSAFMAVSTFILIYAYGGFKTMAAWKLPIAAVVCYSVCTVGVLHYSELTVAAFSQAAIWALFIALFITFLWLVEREIRRRFYADFASELIQQNHDLLQEIRQLHKGCKDDRD